jgi:DNA-binding response OmpR family regulator
MRVLVVEDDTRLADALAAALRRRGYEVLHAATAAVALTAPQVDLVLLDLGLPDRDGVGVCRTLRARYGVAVIAVTARGEVHERVRGLRAGFDDYVVKPFSMAELEARIEAVLRRATPRPAGVLDLGPLRIDLDARIVTRDLRPVTLTRKEFELLAVLGRDAGAVVRRERLQIEVWGTSVRGGRTLDVHMASLRAKLGAPSLIDTLRGVGYRLAVPEPDPLCDGVSSRPT